MYLYIVDAFAQDKKYARDLVAIQSRVQDLGITGRFEKLTVLKSIKDIVHDAERKGVETLVVIGNDKTFNSVVTNLTKSSITIGLIPIGDQNNTIAETLGIPHGADACTVLSKRIIKKLDLGEVNGRYFFSCLDIPNSDQIEIECEKSYTIRARSPEPIHIVNFRSGSHVANANDGKLEAVVHHDGPSKRFFFFSRGHAASKSVFPIKNIRVTSREEKVSIFSDGDVVVKTPAKISVVPAKLRMIVGA